MAAGPKKCGGKGSGWRLGSMEEAGQRLGQDSTPDPPCSPPPPLGWDAETGGDAEDGLRPDVLVSLAAPKRCAGRFSGRHHFVAGRFVPDDVRRKFALRLPGGGADRGGSSHLSHLEGSSPTRKMEGGFRTWWRTSSRLKHVGRRQRAAVTQGRGRGLACIHRGLQGAGLALCPAPMLNPSGRQTRLTPTLPRRLGPRDGVTATTALSLCRHAPSPRLPET
ncbi:Hypothetical predicted protein [Marmota monax]|uniref:Uncharacterized protein n=1 Tax=Marmota monax TaxID=9995 RepID=A0A5E4AC44_MARMO|nr:Hypothetical predicted protein [Marmota monax]